MFRKLPRGLVLSLLVGVGSGLQFCANVARAQTGPQEPPVLLLSTDLLSKKQRSLPLREQVKNQFGFVTDFAGRESDPLPPQWPQIDSEPSKKAVPLSQIQLQSKLQRMLLLGTPAVVKRPKTEFQFAPLALSKVSYFRGDDELTLQLNNALRLWTQGRRAEATPAIDALTQKAVELPPGALQAIQIQLVRGFYYLDLSARSTEAKGNPAAFTAARNSFWNALGKADLSTLATSIDSKVNSNVIEDLFAHPYVFKGGKLLFGEPPANMALTPQSIDPLLWVRSVAMAGYWNTIALNPATPTWPKVFLAADAAFLLYERLEKSLPPSLSAPQRPTQSRAQGREQNFNSQFAPHSGHTILVPSEISKVTQPVALWPRTFRDLLASAEFVKATGMLEALDPLEVLRYSDRAIRQAQSSDLAALSFWLAANVYFDLGNTRLARRFYAFSEVMQNSLFQVSPAALFFGAESAFRNGQWEQAKGGYLKMLGLTGDKEFGPWARLRLAEMAHAENKTDEAFQKCDDLVRNYPTHPVRHEAAVKLFCAELTTLGSQNRNRAAQDLKTLLAELGISEKLKEQGRTCLLQSTFLELADQAQSKSLTVAEQTKNQNDALASFKKEYPESLFLPLFEGRQQILKLAPVADYVQQNRCQDLISFYGKNKVQIEELATKNRTTQGDTKAGTEAGTEAGVVREIVKGLSWGATENRLLARCAVLRADLPLWKNLRTQKLTSKSLSELPEVQQALFDFDTKKTEKNALSLLSALRFSSVEQWLTWAKQSEKQQDDLIRDENFWRIVAGSRLLQFDLSTPASKKKKWQSRLAQLALADVSTLEKNAQACLWVLLAKDQVSSAQWDAIARLRTAEQWLSEKNDEANAKESSGSAASQCFARLGQQLFEVAQARPSATRDKLLLLPFLNSKKIVGAPEEWLAYAQRLARERGTAHASVVSLYKQLKAEAPDPMVKEAAQAWLEGKKPSLY